MATKPDEPGKPADKPDEAPGQPAPVKPATPPDGGPDDPKPPHQ